MMAELDDLRNLARTLPPPADIFAGLEPRESLEVRNVIAWLVRHGLHGGDAFHHRCVLVTCLRTAGAVIVDHHFHILQPGSSLLIFPYQFHHYGGLQGRTWEWLFLTFETPRLEALAPLRGRVTAHSADSRMMLRQILETYREAAGEGLAADRAAAALIHRVALLLLELLRLQPGGGAEPAGETLSPAQEITRQAVRFVQERLDEPLAVEDVAAAVSLSPSRLRTVFREAAGMSLGKFLRSARMRRAQSLIHSTDDSVSAIAEQCGYESVYTFSRAFKHATGRSPTEYRRWSRRQGEAAE